VLKILKFFLIFVFYKMLKKTCVAKKMVWVPKHKSVSVKGKRISVKASCRKPSKSKRSKKAKRSKRSKRSKKHSSHAMLGSRFFAPFCPGTSYYKDDKADGGKVCTTLKGTNFELDKDGKCITESGCSIAVTGPACPGTSMGDVDLPNGNRRCISSNQEVFEINSKGECIDKNKCSKSLSELASDLVKKK
jgi:hypothetical protein